MALKNWKERPNRYGILAYEKSKDNFIFIQKNPFMNNWFVYKNNKIISKGFKTKTQALACAKAYMRTH